MSVPTEGVIPDAPLSPAEILAKGVEASELAPRGYEAPKEDPFAQFFSPADPEPIESPTTPFADLKAIAGDYDSEPGFADEVTALARNSFVFALPVEFTAAYQEEYGSLSGDPAWRNSKWSPSETDIKQASEKHKLLPADYGQLAYARAPEELEIRARVLGERRQNASYVATNYTGIEGFAAQMGVGMFDPAFLLAGGGIGALAKGVKTTTSAGNVLKNMAVAGVADGSLEFANADIDPLVGYQDAAVATLASVAFTGVLSGVGEFLTFREAERMTSQFNATAKAYAEAADEYPQGDAGSSAGAQQQNPVPRILEDEDGNPLLGDELDEEDFVWNVLDAEEGVPDANALPSFGAPVRSVGQSPDAELRGLGSVLVEDPSKPGMQRQTVAEKAHRVNEAGATYLRKMQNSAKNYWRARGKTSVWGGVNPLQQAEFDKIVHMVATREVGNLPKEWLEDADVLEAVQVFRDGNRENLFLLQNRDYTPGSGRDGAWKPRDPNKPWAGVNEGSDTAMEWLTELEEYNRAKPTGEATGAELNRATREGAAVGTAVGAAAGGATGALGSLFLDEDHRYAGSLLGAVAFATLGGRGARNRVRVSRQAQLQRWKRRYPTAGLFVGDSHPSADLEAKARAESMEADGVDRDKIWKDTGWGRDPQGGWITETQTPVGWKPNVETLQLDAEFLETFPEIEEIIVGEAPTAGKAVSGFYRPKHGNNGAEIRIDTRLETGARLATLFHELQHVVQDAGGRPRGSNLEMAKTIRNYVRDQGEAEARLTEARLGKDSVWRRNNPPWAGLDVSEDEIFTTEGIAKVSARLKDDIREMRQDGWLADNSRYQGLDDEGREVWEIDLPGTDDGIVFRLTPYDEGVVEAEWDWQSNAKNPEHEMAIMEGRAEDGMKAFEAVNQHVQALLKEGEQPFIVFTGLTGGHARQQKKLMARRPADSYRAVLAEYETSRLDDDGNPVVMNVFALVKDSVQNMEDTLQGFYSKAKLKLNAVDTRSASLNITEIDEDIPGPIEQGEYTGVRGMENIPADAAYGKRSFNKDGYDAALNLHGEARVREQFTDAIYAHPKNKAYFDELGRRRGRPGWEVARSVAAKYLRTVSKLMNEADPEGNPYRPLSEGRKATARYRLEHELGQELGDDAREMVDMLMEFIAPSKSNDLPNFAKRKLKLELDYQKHEAILDIWDWNATKAFATARRNLAGHVGFNSVGVNDVSRYEARIKKARERAAANPAGQQKVAQAADKLERMTDAIMGISRSNDTDFNRFAVMMKRFNMARLLNKVAFSMFGELGLAATTAGPLRFGNTIMRIGNFRKALKEGRYEEADTWVAFVDDLMGHGTSQVRSRLASSITERGVAETAALSEAGPIWKAFDIGTRKMANASARTSGMAPLTETLRLALGVNLSKKFYKSALKGKMPYSMKRMRDLGIDEAMWQRISTELQNMGKTTSPDTGRSLPDFDRSWRDAEAFDAFVAAIDRKVRRLNMDATVGHTILVAGEKPVWGGVFQFLQFPQGSMLKHTGNAAAMRDPQAAAEILAAGGFSLLGVLAKIYAGAALIKDEEERQAYLDEQLDPKRIAAKAVYYTPHASHIPTLMDVGATTAGFDPLFSQARNSDLSTLGANPMASNPSADFFNDARNIFKSYQGNITQEEAEDFVKLFPLGNHMVTQAVTDEFIQFLPEEEPENE